MLLLKLASENISILQDAVELGEATEDELQLLTDRRKFRVYVNRIDVNKGENVVFPEQPSN